MPIRMEWERLYEMDSRKACHGFCPVCGRFIKALGWARHRTGHWEQYEKLKNSDSQKLAKDIENFHKGNAILAKEEAKKP